MAGRRARWTSEVPFHFTELVIVSSPIAPKVLFTIKLILKALNRPVFYAESPGPFTTAGLQVLETDIHSVSASFSSAPSSDLAGNAGFLFYWDFEHLLCQPAKGLCLNQR